MHKTCRIQKRAHGGHHQNLWLHGSSTGVISSTTEEESEYSKHFLINWGLWGSTHTLSPYSGHTTHRQLVAFTRSGLHNLHNKYCMYANLRYYSKDFLFFILFFYCGKHFDKHTSIKKHQKTLNQNQAVYHKMFFILFISMFPYWVSVLEFLAVLLCKWL